MKNKRSRFFVVFMLLLSVSVCNAGILSGLQGFWKSISNSVSSSISNSSNNKAIKMRVFREAMSVFGLVVSVSLIYSVYRLLKDRQEASYDELGSTLKNLEPSFESFESKFDQSLFLKKMRKINLGLYAPVRLYTPFPITISDGKEDSKFPEKIMKMIEDPEKSTVKEMLVRIYVAWMDSKHAPLKDGTLFVDENKYGRQLAQPHLDKLNNHLENVLKKVLNKIDKNVLDKNEKDVLLLLFDDLAVGNKTFFSIVQKKLSALNGIGELMEREERDKEWSVVGSRLKALNKSKKIPQIREGVEDHVKAKPGLKDKMYKYLGED